MRYWILGWIWLLSCGGLRAQAPFTESHLPILHVRTSVPIPDEPKITGTLSVIDNGPDALNRPSDPATGYDGFIGIESRGQTSQNWPKRSFSVETRKADGDNNNVALLGLPKENDWVLYAAYYDKTLLRNVLTYHLGRRLFPYAPRTRFVELLVNDSYRGVYILTEKIKRDDARVDIVKLKPEDTDGDALTGGYLLKIDKGTDSTGFNFFNSNYLPAPPNPSPIDVLYHDPKADELTPTQRSYIQDYFHAFEAALAGPDFTDPTVGYPAYVDLDSWVDYLILNEVARNLDAYRVSTYFYKRRDSAGGRLHMGPVWDYNFAYGSARFCGSEATTGWAYDFNDVCPQDRWLVPFWWKRLLEDPAFDRAVRLRYAELRQAVLATDSLHLFLDERVADLDAAAERNWARWPGFSYLYPFPTVTYQGGVDSLKNWLDRRLQWLDAEWQLPPEVAPDDPETLQLVGGNGPASFAVQYALRTESPLTLRVHDLAGRLLLTREVLLPAGIGTEPVLLDLPRGAYVAGFHRSGLATVHQLFVQR